MESKLHENLYFAGEIVNIDITVDLTSRMLGRVGFINSLVSSSQFVVFSLRLWK
jgi:hypothetical protein